MLVYKQTKSAVITIMSELKIVPILEFEKLVLCEEDSAFRPTKENMAALKVCTFSAYTVFNLKIDKFILLNVFLNLKECCLNNFESVIIFHSSIMLLACYRYYNVKYFCAFLNIFLLLVATVEPLLRRYCLRRFPTLKFKIGRPPNFLLRFRYSQ
jgi:hypothetical protein